jgi:hypothetical protein
VEWIAVRKEAFEKDMRTLAKLKGRKVQILGLENGTLKVVLLPRDADLRALAGEYDSNSSFEQEILPNLDAATDLQVQLNLGLLQDIISLTSLSNNPERSRNYANLRLHSLQEELESAFSRGEMSNVESVQEAATACKHLVSSMEFNLKDMKVVCSDCKVAAAKVQLSCNHSLCSDCCKSIEVSESLFTLMVSSLESYKQSLNEMDLKSVESILGAVEELAGEPPAKQSSHIGELLTILRSAVNSCVDSLTFSSIQRALSIISLLSNSTSNTDQLAVMNTASDVLACFTRQRLPNETPTTFLSG